MWHKLKFLKSYSNTHQRRLSYSALLVVFSFMTLLSPSLLADDKHYTRFFSNVAVSGYDTVAYFTQNKAVKGSKDFEVEHDGVEWRFANAEHKALFEKNPDKYAPQYGGFCAWAVVAKKARASADPEQWNIVDGKLYLNYDDDIKKKWEEDIPGFISAADIHWPKMLD